MRHLFLDRFHQKEKTQKREKTKEAQAGEGF